MCLYVFVVCLCVSLLAYIWDNMWVYVCVHEYGRVSDLGCLIWLISIFPLTEPSNFTPLAKQACQLAPGNACLSAWSLRLVIRPTWKAVASQALASSLCCKPFPWNGNVKVQEQWLSFKFYINFSWYLFPSNLLKLFFPLFQDYFPHTQLMNALFIFFYF